MYECVCVCVCVSDYLMYAVCVQTVKCVLNCVMCVVCVSWQFVPCQFDGERSGVRIKVKCNASVSSVRV